MPRKTAEAKYPELQRRLDEYVESHHLRRSDKRNKILRLACEQMQPFTAGQLVEAAEQAELSGASVYNVLTLLVQARILHTVHRESTREHAQYEVMAGKSNMIQVKCRRCGREIVITSKPITNAVKACHVFNFDVQRFSLYLYGECKACRSYKRLY